MIKQFILILSLLPLRILSQSYVSTPPVIRYLLSAPKEISYIYCSTKNLIAERNLPRQLRYEAQYLYKTPKGLYMGLQGTGRIYQLSDSNGYLQFTRIDSTFFSGATFNAIPFLMNGEMYSLGGYGFWRRNGLLRRYDPVTSEWNVQLLAQEIPVLNDDFLWIDEKNQRLYVHSPTVQVQGLAIDSTERNRYLEKLLCLDIRSGVWEERGAFRKYAKNISIPTPWGGLWVNGPNDFHLWDIDHNANLKAIPSLNDRLNKLFTQPQPEILFCIDSILYFGDISLGRMDSIELSRSDFVLTGALMQPAASVSKKYSPVFWGAGLAFLGLSLLFFRKSIRGKMAEIFARKHADNKDHGDAKIAEADLHSLFDPVEKELLDLQRRNAAMGRFTSIEEINYLLGLNSKNEAVQKKNRNDMLNTVNQKWAIQTKSEIPLITRTRSDTDKRIYVYSIHPEWLPIIAQLKLD
jgi:hypothetical protein